MMHNNSKVDPVNINAYIKLGEILSGQFVLKILSGNKNLTSVKGHNTITNVPKMVPNNPNLVLVNINAHTKLGEILSVSSLDIERKQKSDISQRAIALLQMCVK